MITCKIVAYLFTLALGYWILTLAEKEKNLNKRIGKWIGWIIMVVSICGCLCSAACHMCCHSKPGCCSSMWGCPMQQGGMTGGPCKMGEPGKMGGPGMQDEKDRANQK